MTTAYLANRIITCAEGSGSGPLGSFESAAIVVSGERIAYVGARDKAPSATKTIDLGDAIITPGLVDAHTHACWVGSRHSEYMIRMAGGDYREIAANGGGIVSTHRAVKEASEDELGRVLRERLLRMAALGVTTVEVKSGYGLEPDLELKQLRAMASCAADKALPKIVPTFLGLHAISPERRNDRPAYVRGQCDLAHEVARQKLASFVDAYVDANAFQVDEARGLLSIARDHGLGIRLHVGQFADVGGGELAAEFQAASVDHVEHMSDGALSKLAAAKTHAVLLPTASFTLGQAPPNVAALRANGIPLVVASDANPGTAPTESLPLALALAVRTYPLHPDEAILGATRHAATSLHERDRGKLVPNAYADFVVWDLPHEYAILQPWGAPRTRLVVREGQVIQGRAIMP